MIDYHLVQVNITRPVWESEKVLFDFKGNYVRESTFYNFKPGL